ncbi:putative acyl-CoA synthetase [Ixodes scapularis]
MLNHIATQMKETGRTFPSVKKLMCAGGSVSCGLQELLLHQLKPNTFRNLYGLSEGLAPITYTPANEICFDNIGFPGCNIRIKVIDRETGILLGPGDHGELCVRTPSVIKGYSRKGQAPLPAVDEDGWLHTGW